MAIDFQDSNIFGDISGNYKTFLALKAKMPKVSVEVSLGDLNDRGPRSRECMEYFMQSQTLWILGNHEHGLSEIYRQIVFGEKTCYNPTNWSNRGFFATLKSFGIDKLENIHKLPKDLINYIENKTHLFLENDKYFLSHGPNNKHVFTDIKEFGRDEDKIDKSIIWNRKPWKRPQDKFFIYGHNGGREVLWHTHDHKNGQYSNSMPQGAWGVCLDSQKANILSAIHLPSMTIYQQEVIDD